ncbi:hypothetical protein KFK09_009837 [Dendrobium nobile]|uniref:Uncharacterized protein n=1 Tax=Dendrobium nobile TaxID=94219 RepID=A0A8T3BI77_DENNO|nr:hypothetical protein KFK09_009837 [Dendrobium nobile]
MASKNNSAYASLQELVKHHIESFDYFLDEGLEKAIMAITPIHIVDPLTGSKLKNILSSSSFSLFFTYDFLTESLDVDELDLEKKIDSAEMCSGLYYIKTLKSLIATKNNPISIDLGPSAAEILKFQRDFFFRKKIFVILGKRDGREEGRGLGRRDWSTEIRFGEKV